MNISTFRTSCLALLSIFMLANQAFSQNTGTLTDKNGEIMRGYPMIVAKHYEHSSTAFALDPENWQTLKDSSRNTVRLCWVGPWMEDRLNAGGNDWVAGVWDMEKVAEVIDSCVSIATEKQMNVIINYHNVGEQQNSDGYVSPEDVNMERLTEFWAKVAPMHKDNDLVYYEITNEPTFIDAMYTEAGFMSNFIRVYDTVRTLAPEREILMFCFNRMSYNFDRILGAYDPYMDWDYTTVAYHMYSTSSSAPVVELALTHKVICTEWFYPSTGHDYVVEVDGYEICAQALEAIGHSWVDWHDWSDASFRLTFNELNPDARAKAYAWWINYGVDVMLLETSVEGEGTILLDPPGGIYEPGTEVVLRAESTSAYGTFLHWSGDLEGSQMQDTLVMDTSKTVRAYFETPELNQVLVYETGQGHVEVDPPGWNYPDSTMITLTAVPDPGHVFSQWGGHLKGTENPIEVLVVRNMSCMATFTDETVSTKEIPGTTGTDPGYSMDLFPVPADHLLHIAFSNKKQCHAGFSIYSFNGSLVKELTNGKLEPGFHQLEAPVMDLAKGIYSVRVTLHDPLSAEGTQAKDQIAKVFIKH